MEGRHESGDLAVVEDRAVAEVTGEQRRPHPFRGGDRDELRGQVRETTLRSRSRRDRPVDLVPRQRLPGRYVEILADRLIIGHKPGQSHGEVARVRDRPQIRPVARDNDLVAAHQPTQTVQSPGSGGRASS
jgi:hypothetical protein